MYSSLQSLCHANAQSHLLTVRYRSQEKAMHSKNDSLKIKLPLSQTLPLKILMLKDLPIEFMNEVATLSCLSVW